MHKVTEEPTSVCMCFLFLAFSAVRAYICNAGSLYFSISSCTYLRNIQRCLHRLNIQGVRRNGCPLCLYTTRFIPRLTEHFCEIATKKRRFSPPLFSKYSVQLSEHFCSFYRQPFFAHVIPLCNIYAAGICCYVLINRCSVTCFVTYSFYLLPFFVT